MNDETKPRKQLSDAGKPRERSASGETIQGVLAQGLSRADPRDPNADVRPPRVSLANLQLKLSTTGYDLDHETYYYYWFAEHPDRASELPTAKAAYYEHETDSEGQPIRVPSGNGFAYLMKILWRYRNEDLILQRKKISDRLTKRARLAPNEYAPDGSDSAISATVDGVKSSVNPFTRE